MSHAPALAEALPALNPLLEGAPIDKVRYRLFLGEAEWRVRRFELTEQLNQPYELVVEALTGDDIDAGALRWKRAELEIDRRGVGRSVPGVVRSVERLDAADGTTALRFRIVPALWLLSQSKRSRIFQDQNLVEVIEAVVGPVFSAYRRTIVFDFNRNYDARDYLVQYDESDLAFIHRLMEEEGIAYRFEVSGDRETLVLTDQNSGFPAMDTFDGAPEIPIETVNQDEATTETIGRLDWTDARHPAQTIQSQWDPEVRPPEIFHSEIEDNGAIWPRTMHEHDDRRVAGELADRLARVKHEELVARDQVGNGSSNVTALEPGRSIEVMGHADGERDAKYIVTKVIHRGDSPEADLPISGESDASYENAFEVIPIDVEYRPPRVTPQPCIVGPQTGIVVGPDEADEEIYTQHMGCVQVAFHWAGGVASCWLRVAQALAGNGFGAMVLPRIGMEVVVNFLNGDPARPLVTGCVYNGANSPPLDLPNERTCTTLRTQSTPGGEGYNELCFDDTAGRERVSLRAQRNLNFKVGNTFNLNVGGNQSWHIKKDQTTTVDGSDTTTVEKDRVVTVEGSDQLTVNGSQLVRIAGGPALADAESPDQPGAQLEVDGEYHVNATKRIVLRCGDSSITLEPTGIVIETSLNLMLKLGDDQFVQLRRGTTLMQNTAVTVNATGGAYLRLDSHAMLEANDQIRATCKGSELQLGGYAELKGAENTYVTAAADVVLDGASASMLATGDVQIESAQGGVGISAPAGDVVVKGQTIHLN